MVINVNCRYWMKNIEKGEFMNKEYEMIIHDKKNNELVKRIVLET